VRIKGTIPKNLHLMQPPEGKVTLEKKWGRGVVISLQAHSEQEGKYRRNWQKHPHRQVRRRAARKILHFEGRCGEEAENSTAGDNGRAGKGKGVRKK